MKEVYYDKKKNNQFHESNESRQPINSKKYEHLLIGCLNDMNVILC